MNAAALTFLQQRSSVAKLVAPAPNVLELNEMFKAAVRAPDHARLKPWRFIVIEGDARNVLGEVFVAAQEAGSGKLDADKRQKLAAKPLRAPMIIAVLAKTQEHLKVPICEQQLSAACAAFAILLAAEALGYAGIWRTGGMAYHQIVDERLGVQSNENIVGFLYIGTAEGEPKPLGETDLTSLVSYFTG
jgi:nitroreductase